MSLPTVAARRRGFLVPADLAAGLVTCAAGVWLLGSTWGGPLALGGAAGAGGCWLVGGAWVWDALRNVRTA